MVSSFGFGSKVWLLGFELRVWVSGSGFRVWVYIDSLSQPGLSLVLVPGQDSGLGIEGGTLASFCHSVKGLKVYRGTSLIRNSTLPWDHHRTRGVGRL